jgi:hypothetical protein
MRGGIVSRVEITIIAVALMISAVTIGVIGGIGYIVDSYSCRAKTQDIGLAYRYQYIGGCQIEVKRGIWIPLANYRVVP